MLRRPIETTGLTRDLGTSSHSELLYLFEKHGYRAKIDLKEAKKLLGEVDRS